VRNCGIRHHRFSNFEAKKPIVNTKKLIQEKGHIPKETNIYIGQKRPFVQKLNNERQSQF
jgi:hypothetical protein